jgi:type II secretory pathway pseudopilin PulG
MYRARAITLVELIVVIATVVVLAAVMIPVFGRAKRNGLEVSCMARLRQIHHSIEIYGADNDGYESVSEDISVSNTAMTNPTVLIPYLGSAEMLFCPATPQCAKDKLGSSYVWSGAPRQGHPLFQSAQYQLAERYGDPSKGYPIVHCLVHDELFVYPGERHLQEQLNPPYVIRLLPDGSVVRGRFDVHRGHDIARACAN